MLDQIFVRQFLKHLPHVESSHDMTTRPLILVLFTSDNVLFCTSFHRITFRGWVMQSNFLGHCRKSQHFVAKQSCKQLLWHFPGHLWKTIVWDSFAPHVRYFSKTVLCKHCKSILGHVWWIMLWDTTLKRFPKTLLQSTFVKNLLGATRTLV